MISNISSLLIREFVTKTLSAKLSKKHSYFFYKGNPQKERLDEVKLKAYRYQYKF